MTRFNNIVKIVREHARIYWTASEAGLGQVEITKLDVAVDMKGSFLPHLHQEAYQHIKARFRRAISQIFDREESNFLSNQ